MNKLIIPLCLLFANPVFAEQAIYKCTIKGKTEYSNEKTNKDCQNIEIKEINVLNSPKIEKKLVVENKINKVGTATTNVEEKNSSTYIVQKKKEIEDKYRKMEEDHIENLDRAIKILGG